MKKKVCFVIISLSFVIGCIIVYTNNDKSTNKIINYNGNNLMISIDGNTSTTLPTNGDYYFDFISPKNIFITKEELINVYAMMQIHQVFLSTNGTFTCQLRKFCQNKRCGLFMQKVDRQCLKQPWERMSKCYFNIWWKFKGFGNIKIVHSIKN